MRTAVPRINPGFDNSNFYSPLSDDPDTFYIDICQERGNPRSKWITPKSGSKGHRPRRRKSYTKVQSRIIPLRSEKGRYLPGPRPNMGRRDKRLDSVYRASPSAIDAFQSKILKLKKVLRLRGELIPHAKKLMVSQLIRANLLHDSLLPYVRCHKGWIAIVRITSTSAFFRLLDLMIHCLSTAMVDTWISTFLDSIV